MSLHTKVVNADQERLATHSLEKLRAVHRTLISYPGSGLNESLRRTVSGTDRQTLGRSRPQALLTHGHR